VTPGNVHRMRRVRLRCHEESSRALTWCGSRGPGTEGKGNEPRVGCLELVPTPNAQSQPQLSKVLCKPQVGTIGRGMKGGG